MTFSLVLLLAVLGQFGQPDSGELRVIVADETGLPLPSTVLLASDVAQVRRQLDTDALGVATARRLPFGRYRVTVTRDGFAVFDGVVDVRSALPIEYRVTLVIAPFGAQVAVTPEATLLDPRQTTTIRRIGADLVQQHPAAAPGRALPELVNTQPGWLLEAGGSLHPRGSENQTQYVVDGLPLTDNRSPGFAPELDADAVHALGILTGGYPAEYGRKLGGVIEIVTASDARRGFHGDGSASIASFNTTGADAHLAYGWPRGSFSVSGAASATDRYLDPPVEENFTNHGETSQAAVRVERDRLGLIVRRARTVFNVPNEADQETAGQRQVRDSGESMAQVSYQRIFSASLVGSVHGMARDLSAGLSSNAAATPIAADQHRGLREGYVKGTITWHAGAHDWKAGADLSAGRVQERFSYRISDPSAFDPGTRPVFAFADRALDREYAMFVQNEIRAGRWTLNAGVRWDAYHFVVSERALSPRLAVAWSPAAHVSVRASYDRAFQTPATENLLLASSPAADALGETVVRLPVRPSRGNFYEMAVSKTFFDIARVDAAWYDRRVTHFADDDLLLNTGVSFPIAFDRADVHGAEVKVDVPRWKALGGSLSYSWMRGEGTLPLTGGLFLGGDADVGSSNERFAVTQDQRHTIRGRVTAQVRQNAWGALAASYDSGLPFEFTGDRSEAVAAFGRRIVDQVDFETGRVRPSLSVDASAGVAVLRARRSTVRLQADIRNLTGRLRVINFAGLFSGTALAAPRSVALRARVEF